jgi:acylphosphatase
MTQRIQLRVYPDGRIEAVVQGVKGKKCTDYIAVLEELLQAETVESAYTPEYYEPEEVRVRQEELAPQRIQGRG